MTDHLRDRIAAALYERERPPRDPHWADAYAMDREVFEAMADAVLAALLATGPDREPRIKLDDLNSDQLDGLYGDLDRYTEILGEMNDNAIRQAKELAEAQAKAATPRELELRQRHAWSAAGQCPMCGYDDCGGRLCADCTTTVRRLPANDQRQWNRYKPTTDSAPI